MIVLIQKVVDFNSDIIKCGFSIKLKCSFLPEHTNERKSKRQHEYKQCFSSFQIGHVKSNGHDKNFYYAYNNFFLSHWRCLNIHQAIYTALESSRMQKLWQLIMHDVIPRNGEILWTMQARSLSGNCWVAQLFFPTCLLFLFYFCISLLAPYQWKQVWVKKHFVNIVSCDNERSSATQ